jgi:hypothetical protein
MESHDMYPSHKLNNTQSEIKISTSVGRYFSKACISGSFTDVCPATTAPTFVAIYYIRRGEERKGRYSTWTIHSHYFRDILLIKWRIHIREEYTNGYSPLPQNK